MNKIPLYLSILLVTTVLSPHFLHAQSKSTATAAPTSAQEQARYRFAADYSRQMRGLSILVMKNGRVVFEEYHNGHTAQSPHMLASGTKSFNGVMAAAAVDDGLLKLDDRVCDTISEWKSDARKSKITVRQLLSLTGGLEPGAIGRPATYDASIGFNAQFEPGTTFEYGPTPFQVWGELMRRKLAARGSNETPLDYLRRRVFNPIGLSVASWTHQNGQPNLPSGAALTAREWAKFGQFVLQDGKWGEKQLIAKKSMDECFVGSTANPNYGLTWWLNRSSDGTANVAPSRMGMARFGRAGTESESTQMSKNGVGARFPRDLKIAAGLGKQRLYVIPSQGLVIVRQGRQSRFDDAEFLERLLN